MKKELSELVHLFDYKDGELYWKNKPSKIVNAGDKAGHLNKQCGRIYVMYKRDLYLAHRIIFQMFNGYCPEYLDHIDGNPLNNKIENLRPATKQQNAMNRKVRSSSFTGLKGVMIKRNKFGASIFLNGKAKYLGTYATAFEANLAYQYAARHYFGEFARI